MITCDLCNETGKGRYKTVLLDDKPVTMCNDCRYGKGVKRGGKSMNQLYDDLQVPFWKLMGQKPKPKDIKLEKYLKNRGMTYGDWRRERDYKMAKHQSALPEYEAHIKKYGRNNAKSFSFSKDNH